MIYSFFLVKSRLFWQLTLTKVLLLGSASQTIIGRPILPDATVHALVEEHVSVSLCLATCIITITSEAVHKKKIDN